MNALKEIFEGGGENDGVLYDYAKKPEKKKNAAQVTPDKLTPAPTKEKK